MRGDDRQPAHLFSYVSAEGRVPRRPSAASDSSAGRCLLQQMSPDSTGCGPASGVPRFRRSGSQDERRTTNRSSHSAPFSKSGWSKNQAGHDRAVFSSAEMPHITSPEWGELNGRRREFEGGSVGADVVGVRATASGSRSGVLSATRLGPIGGRLRWCPVRETARRVMLSLTRR